MIATPSTAAPTSTYQLAQILELLAEDSRLNVYADQLEVRPPGAPTTLDPERACRPPWRVASEG